LANWVCADPTPAHRAGEGAAKHGVDLPDRTVTERLAAVRAATFVAFVFIAHAVLDERPTRAMGTAPLKFGVVGVERLAVDASDGEIAEHWLDVFADQAFVPVAGCVLHPQHAHVALQELVHGCTGAGIALLVNFGEQLGPDLLGFLGRFRAGGDDLRQVVPLACDRVNAGVHADPERPAGERFDLATGSSLGLGRCRHGAMVAAFAP